MGMRSCRRESCGGARGPGATVRGGTPTATMSAGASGGRDATRVPAGTVRVMPSVERPAMSDYGVPSDTAGTLPWSWAQERLVANRNYWLVDGIGRRGVPTPCRSGVCGSRAPTGFWFSCAPNARKARNIAENPQCTVTVDDTVECVSVEGVARAVDADDPAEVCRRSTRLVAAYLTKYWVDPAVHADMEGVPPRQRHVRGDSRPGVRHHRTRGRVRRARDPVALLSRRGRSGGHGDVRVVARHERPGSCARSSSTAVRRRSPHPMIRCHDHRRATRRVWP